MLGLSTSFLSSLWIWSTFILCLYQYFTYQSSNGCKILRRTNNDNVAPIVYAIIFAILIGLRPTKWADSANYTIVYNYLLKHQAVAVLEFNTSKEWLWEFIQGIFIGFKLPVNYFFLFITTGYIGFIVWANKRLAPHNQWLLLLFCISSFSFLTYSYNGLRNGLACSIMLLAFTYYMSGKRKDLYIGLVWTIIAMGFHRSAILPAICIIASLYMPKTLNWSIAFYIFAILISLTFGPKVQEFFALLGYDERMTSYAGQLVENTDEAQKFSHTGFRWDFLLYSIMPIVLGYYIVFKRQVFSRKYITLLNTYILANAFWIMVIQAAYSNRFAYLSWFMYPWVIAYPLLRIPFVKDQDRFTANILILFVGFTVFMNLIYW